jgi:hypothetical protein
MSTRILLPCGIVFGSSLVYFQRSRKVPSNTPSTPTFIPGVTSATDIHQALSELDSAGFCCIGPALLPRITASPCLEACAPSFSPFRPAYRPSAPGRHHRIDFDTDALAHFATLERAWLPLVDAFFAAAPAAAAKEAAGVPAEPSADQEEHARLRVPPERGGRAYYRSECQLLHTAAGTAGQFFHQVIQFRSSDYK